MNPKVVQDVREKLDILGYRNVPDRIIEEFAWRLHDRGRLGSSRPRKSRKSQRLAEGPDAGRRSDRGLRQCARRLMAIRARARRLDSAIRTLHATSHDCHARITRPGEFIQSVPIAAGKKRTTGNTNYGPPHSVGWQILPRHDSGDGA
jgi:hypothetical protein